MLGAKVNLRSVHRQKYACLHVAADDDDNVNAASSQHQGDVRISTLIPWGWQSLFALEFVEGRYALRTNDDHYVHRDGRLVTGPPSADATYTVELKSGGTSVSLRDRAGRYLTGVGRDAVVQGRNAVAGKDELFVIEAGHPQVVILAHNGRMVSIKQGTATTPSARCRVGTVRCLESDVKLRFKNMVR